MIALSLVLGLLAQQDPWLGSDEMLHVGLTAAISAGGYAGGRELGAEVPRLLTGAVLGVGAAAAKELFDVVGGDPSVKDFVLGVAGTAIGLFVAWMIDRLLWEPEVPLWRTPAPAAE